MVSLGSPFESEARAQRAYNLKHRTVHDDVTGDVFVVRGADETYVSDLVDLLARYFPSQPKPDDSVMRELSLLFGEPVSSPPCREWLESLLQEDGMVDTFAELHPDALDRFTCWDQYRNRRYFNEGTRIDYVLVDELYFKQHVAPVPLEPLYGIEDSDYLSRAAAQRAATSHGKWKPAPFDGSGIVDGSQADYDSQFFRPHTGMVYTPPQYSDHIGVSALLNVKPEPDLSRSKRFNKATRKSQPHAQQKRISNFFVKKAANQAPEPTAPVETPSAAPLAASVVQDRVEAAMDIDVTEKAAVTNKPARPSVSSGVRPQAIKRTSVSALSSTKKRKTLKKSTSKPKLVKDKSQRSLLAFCKPKD